MGRKFLPGVIAQTISEIPTHFASDRASACSARRRAPLQRRLPCGVLAQRLVRKICPHCKEIWKPDAHTADAIVQACGDFDELHRGAGCSRCRGTGFAGRIGVFELLVPDAEFLDAVAEGATLQAMRARLEAMKFQTLRDDGMSKVRAGLTTPDEILCATRL